MTKQNLMKLDKVKDFTSAISHLGYVEQTHRNRGEYTRMKKLSVDNGQTFSNYPSFLAAGIEKVGWNTIVNAMGDDIREIVYNRDVNMTNVSFLTAYLKLCKNDLVIG